MCGRFTQTKTRKEILDQQADIELPPLFHRRYNVAPSQTVAIIKQESPNITEEASWGFSHSSSKSLIINARSESLTEKPTFKDLITNHRCLIPADGFFEWKGKQPYYFQIENNQLFGFAGLWRNGQCVIITREADHNMNCIHHRMPVILSTNLWTKWLTQPYALPKPPPTLHSRPVSIRVNTVANDDASCLSTPPVQTDFFG